MAGMEGVAPVGGLRGVAIRPMAPGDFAAFNEVDGLAFGKWLREGRGRHETPPARPFSMLSAYLRAAPQACWVADLGGRVVGGIFGHRWGGVGWVGPFCVLPDFQRKGLGQALLEAAAGALERGGAEMVGLETMPDSAYNVGLYARRGFLPEGLRLRLSAPPGAPRPEEPLRPQEPAEAGPALRMQTLTSEAELEAAAPAMRALSGRLEAGLDYQGEAAALLGEGLARALLGWRGGDLAGFCLYLLLGRRGEEQGSSVYALAVDPQAAEREQDAALDALLAAWRRDAAAAGKTALSLAVYGGYGRALQRLLGAGFRVQATGVRMTRGPLAGNRYILRPSGFHLAGWSG